MIKFKSYITENIYKFTKEFKAFRNKFLNDVTILEYEEEANKIENLILELYKYVKIQDKAVTSKYKSVNKVIHKYGLSHNMRRKFMDKK